MTRTPPPIIPGRFNTILYCHKWSETVHFYETQLGLTAVFRNDWFVEFQIRDHCFVSVANAAHATIAAVNGQGITLTLNVENLEEIHYYLQSQGLNPTAIRPRWGAKLFYCHDPEGHRLEFWREEG